MTDIQPIAQETRYALPELTTIHPKLQNSGGIWYAPSTYNFNFVLTDQQLDGRSLLTAQGPHFSVRHPPSLSGYRKRERYLVVIRLGDEGRWYALCRDGFRPCPRRAIHGSSDALRFQLATHFDTLEAAVRAAVAAITP